METAQIQLDRDLVVRYRVADDSSPRVQAYRDKAVGDPGFFEASAILPAASTAKKSAPKTVLLLFDTSLSMQWEKLERAFKALETILHSLSPDDRFNVLVFNSDTAAATPA